MNLNDARLLAKTVWNDELAELGGQMVRAAWVEFCEATQDNPKYSHVLPWEKLGEWDKAVDRHIAFRLSQPYLIRIEELKERIEELENSRPDWRIGESL